MTPSTRLEGAVWVSGNIPNRLKETVGMEKPYQGQRLEKTRPFNLVHKFHISYDTTKDLKYAQQFSLKGNK